jgi:hypothetical protein
MTMDSLISSRTATLLEVKPTGLGLVRHSGGGRNPDSGVDWTPAFAGVTKRLTTC